MACRKGTMKWKRAMRIATKNYPHASIKRRRRIASAIIRKTK